MGASRRKSSMTPPVSDEALEKKLVSLAMQRAQELLESSDPPPSVVVHFLKLGSERAKLENAKLEAEGRMLTAKEKALEAQARTDQLFEDALHAFATYRSTARGPDE